MGQCHRYLSNEGGQSHRSHIWCKRPDDAAPNPFNKRRYSGREDARGDHAVSAPSGDEPLRAAPLKMGSQRPTDRSRGAERVTELVEGDSGRKGRQHGLCQMGGLQERAVRRVLQLQGRAGDAARRVGDTARGEHGRVGEQKGPKAASGSGGGSSDAAEEEDVGVFSAAKRTWTSKSMPQVRRLLFARAMVELSVMIFHSTFADYVLRKYEWDQKKTGYGMALAGGLSVLVDLIIVPILHSYRMLGVLPAGLIGGVLVASGLLSLSVAVKTDGFFLGLTLLSLGTALFKSNFNTIVMGVAKQVNSRSTAHHHPP